LKTLGLVDRIVPEPLGGAHRDYDAMMVTMKKALSECLRQVQERSLEELRTLRFDKIMAYGRFKEVAPK
jgi:acetyl-CoA carboxylase carboxyl transferase subunit alpha